VVLRTKSKETRTGRKEKLVIRRLPKAIPTIEGLQKGVDRRESGHIPGVERGVSLASKRRSRPVTMDCKNSRRGVATAKPDKGGKGKAA